MFIVLFHKRCVEIMVTGYGTKGGRGRCFTLWRDLLACAESHGTYGRHVCGKEREDYIECLHHTKLVSCHLF